jgi:hypothetical protein
MDQVLFYVGWILGRLSTMQNISKTDEVFEKVLTDWVNDQGIDVFYKREKNEISSN